MWQQLQRPLDAQMLLDAVTACTNTTYVITA